MHTSKFRGQILDGPRKGEWVYGYYYVNTLGMHNIVQENGQTSEVDPKTVGQYIGEQDFIGRELYEGDEIRVTYTSTDPRRPAKEFFAQIIYGKDFIYEIFCNEEAIDDFNIFRKNRVILWQGTIHDNPDLLTQ